MNNGTWIKRRTTVLAENGVPIFVGLPWSILATDDMNMDGKPDIIWHNAASGETQIWYMNTNRITGRATVYWENNTGPAFVGLLALFMISARLDDSEPAFASIVESWPSDRGIEDFRKWFECRLYSMGSR